MAHLQLLRSKYGDAKCKIYRLEKLLRGLGYSSLTFEGDGRCNEWGNIYIVTKNGRYFTNSTMSTAVNWGKMCLTEDEFLNEAIREIRLFEKKKEVIPDLQLDSIRTVREYCTEHSRIWLEIYEDNPKVCVITHLLVDEDHRRKGYGTKALEQAEIIAKDLGCDTIHLKVETYSWMSKWYLRSGYRFLTNAEDNYTWLTKSI